MKPTTTFSKILVAASLALFVYLLVGINNMSLFFTFVGIPAMRKLYTIYLSHDAYGSCCETGPCNALPGPTHLHPRGHQHQDRGPPIGADHAALFGSGSRRRPVGRPQSFPNRRRRLPALDPSLLDLARVPQRRHRHRAVVSCLLLLSPPALLPSSGVFLRLPLSPRRPPFCSRLSPCCHDDVQLVAAWDVVTKTNRIS